MTKYQLLFTAKGWIGDTYNGHSQLVTRTSEFEAQDDAAALAMADAEWQKVKETLGATDYFDNPVLQRAPVLLEWAPKPDAREEKTAA